MTILYSNKSSTDISTIAVYVDDILLTGSNPAEIEHVKQHLHSCFGIKDLGRLHYFLGIEVSYIPQGIVLSQKKSTTELLKDSKLSSYRPTVTPLPPNCKLHLDEGNLLPDPLIKGQWWANLIFLLILDLTCHSLHKL